MSEKRNETEFMPELTLTPFEEESPKMEKVELEEEKDWNDQMLSEEEQRMVDQFASQIDLKNSTLILQYGAGTQKKMADFSENALEKVRTKDLGEVGNLLSDLTVELKSFDAGEEKKFLGIFKKASNKITSIKAKYAKVENNVEEIARVLENHQVQLLKDVAILDKMYQLNLTYFKELSMYILAGKKKLSDVRANDLMEALDRAKRSGLPEDAQAAKDLESSCDRFEKKLHDLELTRMISIQTAPQIRLVQSSDTMMVEKIQSTLVNTIPLWKSQMVLALGMEHSSQAVKVQREVSDLTNELLKKNAEKLKTATIEVAKESERGIVDLETLKTTNASLISTLDEVMQIQEQGKQKRREAEAEIGRLEVELKNKLLEIRS
ncbi:MAG: toxic anion resistance protein [Candidatus Fimousia sp.]|uniref:toxic anion resistance protein n=1 Tax=Anaerostipes sp. 992a TaxID=1261637 RepID=UPI0009520243|nr:toxic anion resistance protein [Anaerostipes sp. 992a]OLR63688.1 tellurium resistance protein [Anaerostipes sp. 992a]